MHIPDIRYTKWNEIISTYLRQVEELNSEPARSHRFAMLLQELLGIYPDFIENYSRNIEKYLKIKEKDRLLRGRADNLFVMLLSNLRLTCLKSALKPKSNSAVM